MVAVDVVRVVVFDRQSVHETAAVVRQLAVAAAVVGQLAVAVVAAAAVAVAAVH